VTHAQKKLNLGKLEEHNAWATYCLSSPERTKRILTRECRAIIAACNDPDQEMDFWAIGLRLNLMHNQIAAEGRRKAGAK
jgi:hypothetical protein